MKSVKIKNISLLLPGIFSQEEFVSHLQSGECLKESDLTTFKPAKHLSDRRMLKAVSHRDGYSLAAIEQLKKMDDDHDDCAPESRGLFVGACPSSMSDYDSYAASVKSCMDSSGTYKADLFGKECMTSRPTTLLLGLPNNVLCYGSMILDARGPNNNFVSEGTSAMSALASAKRAMTLKRIEKGYVGAYTYQSDNVRSRLNKRLRDRDDRNHVDGASFCELSHDQGSVEIVDIEFASADKYRSERFVEICSEFAQRLLSKHDLNWSDICLVTAPESIWLEDESFQKWRNIFDGNTDVISLDKKIGYLSEVSGLPELCLISAVNDGKFNVSNSDSERSKFKMIFTSSLDGDIAIALVK